VAFSLKASRNNVTFTVLLACYSHFYIMQRKMKRNIDTFLSHTAFRTSTWDRCCTKSDGRGPQNCNTYYRKKAAPTVLRIKSLYVSCLTTSFLYIILLNTYDLRPQKNVLCNKKITCSTSNARLPPNFQTQSHGASSVLPQRMFRVYLEDWEELPWTT
jgi:hypothetical protein